MSNPDQLQSLIAAARAVVKADDSHELQQSQIERLRSAIAAASSTEAAAMAATVPAVDYLDGVNIPDLTKALVWLGVATAGQEEMAARLSWYVNQIVSAVLGHKELWPAPKGDSNG